MNFEKGDKFIRYSPYGGIVKGVVEKSGYVQYNDLDNKISYQIPYIKTSIGVLYYLDGSDGRIFRVLKEYSDSEIKIMMDKLNIQKSRKDRLRKIHEEYLDKLNDQENLN